MDKTSRNKQQKQKSFGKREIDVSSIFKALWKKLWLILLVGVVCGGLTYAATKVLVTPTYRSGFTAYVNNKKGMDIIKGLIRILNEIEMDIVCEGVETKDEEKIVYEFGCDAMQGFLYDRPIPIDTFEDKYILRQVI